MTTEFVQIEWQREKRELVERECPWKTLTYSLTSVRLCPGKVRRISIRADWSRMSLTFCEADNLLNEGVATPLCRSVRVMSSSHLINHCIAFSSASNFARLHATETRNRKCTGSWFVPHRYRTKPTMIRRTMINERLMIIQPHIGMSAAAKKKRCEIRKRVRSTAADFSSDTWCCWNRNGVYQEWMWRCYQWNRSDAIDSTIAIVCFQWRMVRPDRQQPPRGKIGRSPLTIVNSLEKAWTSVLPEGRVWVIIVTKCSQANERASRGWVCTEIFPMRNSSTFADWEKNIM